MSVNWDELSTTPPQTVNWDDLKDTPPKESDKGGFIKAVKSVGGSTLAGTGRALKDVGLDTVGDIALEKGKEIENNNKPAINSLGDIVDHPSKWTSESAGQMAGQAGAALASGAAGASLGAGLGVLAGPFAPVVIPALSAAGGYIGGNLPMLAQEYGSEREQQLANGVDDKGRALTGATLTTAIENLGGFKPGGMAGAGKQIVSDLAGKSVKEGAKVLAKKSLQSGLSEAAEEIPQQYTGAYGAGTDIQNLNTKENAQDAAFGAAMALPGGTMFGSANTLVNHYKAEKQAKEAELKRQQDLADTANTGALGSALASGGVANTDTPVPDKTDPQALRPWEEPSYADYKNQPETNQQGYVPAEAGKLWESPDLTDLQLQADRASKLTAFHEKEQADIAQKDAELKAMALRADNTPDQTRAYRKKRLELRAKSDQLNKDLAEALKEATQTSFGPEVKNTQLSDQLQEKLNVKPTRNPVTKTNTGVTSELNPTDAVADSKSGNADTTASSENTTTDQATTGKLTNDSVSSENQSKPNDATQQSESTLGQRDQQDAGGFNPTHTLNDGTLVKHVENNIYVDKHGEEWQADDALKLPSTENKASDLTKNVEKPNETLLNEKIDDQSSQTTNEAKKEEIGKEIPFVKVTDQKGKAFHVLKTDLAGDKDRVPKFSVISGKRLPTPILRTDINHESLNNENISGQVKVSQGSDLVNSLQNPAVVESESQVTKGVSQPLPSEAKTSHEIAVKNTQTQLPNKIFDNSIKSLGGLSVRDFVSDKVNENTQFSEDNGKFYIGDTTGAGKQQVTKAVHTYGQAYQAHLNTAIEADSNTDANILARAKEAISSEHITPFQKESLDDGINHIENGGNVSGGFAILRRDLPPTEAFISNETTAANDTQQNSSVPVDNATVTRGNEITPTVGETRSDVSAQEVVQQPSNTQATETIDKLPETGDLSSNDQVNKAPAQQTPESSQANTDVHSNSENVDTTNSAYKEYRDLHDTLSPILESLYKQQKDNGRIGDARVDSQVSKLEKQLKDAEQKYVKSVDEKKPDATNSEMADLKEQMGQAIGELASLLGGKHNLTEEEETKLLPIMSKIFRIAAKMGYAKFKDSAGYVMQQIRELAGNDVADKLALHNLQAGYINMGGNIRDTMAYDTIGQLEKDYVKNGANLQENGHDHSEAHNTGATNDSVRNTSETANASGVSNKEQKQPKQSGTTGSDQGLRTGREQYDSVDSKQSQGDGLSGDEGLVGHKADVSTQHAVGGQTSTDRSVSESIGSDNYSLLNKKPIALTPAKRRDVNILAEAILKKPVNDITEDDKNILRQYTGNGGLDLKASADKGDSIFNQHYSAYDTIKSMYGALMDAGIKMVNNLEPSVGSGNFIGMHPQANWTAVDIDKTNTEIVTRLYPDAKVFNESYETFRGKGYDLIISNVPFASFSSLAREYAGTIKPMFKAIHNFFFAQSIDKLKTGGVMAFMTSTGTMDGTGEGQRLRQHLVSQMDVIGAFRLPMGTQKANASTDVMIDVIFLQKRPEGVESKQADKNQSFVNIASKDGHKINQYFIDYPESVLGELSIGANKTSMGKVGWIVTGEADYSKMKIEPQDYTATKKAEQDSFTDPDAAQQYADKNGLKFIDGTTKPFFKDGIIYDKAVSYSEFSGGGLFGRKATGVSADKMAALQKIDETHDAELVHDYEHKYSKPPHTDKLLELWAKNVHAVQQLKSYLSLFDKHFSLSDIFTKQVRFENSGKIEVDEHSPLYDRAESLENADGIFSPKTDLLSADEIQGLLDSNDYAKLPNGDLQNARLYYAGNIYEKLDDATKVKPAAQRDKQIERLTRAKPALIPIKDITLTGKETWLPDSAITAIGKKTYDDGTVIIGDRAIEDNHLLHLFNQYLNNDKLVAKGRDDTPEEYADRLKAAQDTLHNEVLPLIKQRLLDDGLADEIVDAYNRTKNFFAEPIFDGSSLKNLPETFRGKPFKLMQHQLEGAERAIYNKKGVLAFSPGLGKTPTAIVVADQLLQKGVMKKPLFIVPANTIPQWEATTRDLYPNAKVYEFPKYTSGINKGKPKDWPSMSAADKEKMAYDLTNNQYDYTFISTNLAQKFTIPPKRLGEYVDKLTESISSMEKDDEDLNKSQIKAKVTRIAKIRMLKATIMASYADSNANGFDMGKMGFDALFADEVQYYKNIGMQSEDAKGGIGANVAINAKYPLIEKNGKMVADMTQSPLSVSLGSSRSYDFRFKTQFISENNNGNNIFLLTGTPTPNKPLELLTLLFHLDTKILDEYHIDNVGQFVDEFLDIQAVEETAVDGAAKLKDQLVAIKNIFGLKKIISRYIDYRSPESASDLTRPKQNDITHVILQSDESQEIFEDVQTRILQAVEDSKTKRSGGIVEEEKMIAMYGAGRDASVDVRLYTPSKLGKGNIAEGTVFQKETRSQYSKIAKTVELVAAKNKLDPEAGQLIFLDRLKFSSGNSSTHEDIRNDILEATGLKPNQVVFVNGGEYVNPNTGKIAKNIKPEMLQTIMDDYNAGKIKVLIGNTTKLGVGVDLQTTTTDIYQLDKPYRPDEIEQRNNRGVRQGNRNAVVNVHTFNQPGTFDAMSDRIIESKQGFNDVFWKTQASDKANVKGEEAPGHFDAAIELERDPLKKRKLEIQRDLNQASAKKSQIEKQVSALAKRIRSATEAKTQYENANQGIDTRAAPKYEDQTEAERKKFIIAWQKRQAEQRALNVGRIGDINNDLVELEDNKAQRTRELQDHNAHIANIRDRYVINGVVSLDAIRSGGDIQFSKASILLDDTKPKGISEAQADAIIAKFINDFNGIDGVTFAHHKTLADAIGETEAKKIGRVKGYYLPLDKTITIIRNALHNVQDATETLRHETIGHFGLNLLTPIDKFTFLASIARDKDTSALRPFFDDVARDYPEIGSDEFMQAEEVFAKVAEEQPTALAEWLDRQLLKLSWLLKKIGFLKGNVTKAEMRKIAKSFAEGIHRGDKQQTFPKDNQSQFSRSTPANTDSDNKAIKDIFTKVAGNPSLDWLGGLFTRNQLIDFIAKDVPEMMNYKLLSQAKDNATHQREQQVAVAYDEMSNKIKEDARKPNGWVDYAKARRMMMELSRVQSMATNLDNFDPAEAKPNQAMTEQEREVYDAYQAMNEAQRAVYIKMRDDYRTDLKATQKALIENLDRFPIDSQTKAAVVADIKAHFDKALSKGVYFPLARFGKIVVTGINPDGELVTSFVESNGARDKLMAKMEAQGYNQVRSQLKAEYDADVANGNAAHTIAALATNTIENIRDNLVKGQSNKIAGNVNDMLDAFNQELIKALPDSSFRKHFIHRKGTLGESADTLRAYANTRNSTAKGLASIGYDHQIAETLQDGRKAIKALGLRNSDFLDSIMNEFTKREKALKTTSIQPWAHILTSLGFMGALGFNVASAGVNMLQVAAIGLPELAGRHGFNASSIAISKAYKLLLDPDVLNKRSGFDLMKNPKINAKTKEALQRLHDIGKIDLNQTHDSISAGQNPSYSTNAVTRVFGKTAKYSGYFFHVAEALNRQVMGIAAFELEYTKNGGDYEKALAYTVKAIDDTQFDYGQGNRSRFMMGNTARVLTLFKAYALNTSWYIGRNAALSLSKLPSEERLQARKTLAVTMAMSFATSGLFGMPIGIEAFAGIGGVAGFKYKGASGSVAGAILGMAVFQTLLAGLGADDDDELETEFRNWLTDNFNQTVAEFITKGPARLLPIGDISGRTAMNHLWYQPQNKELEGRDEFNAISNTLMGPVASQIANIFMASKLWADGESGRALEAMTPRAVSNLIAAERLAMHGVETIKGDKIVDRDLTVNEIAQKMLGFNPTVIANANDANSAITKERDKLDMEKQHLVKRYLSADAEERTRLFNEDIKDFNEEVPASARITKMSLFRSMKARKGANKHTENGLYLSKKQQYLKKISRFAEP